MTTWWSFLQKFVRVSNFIYWIVNAQLFCMGGGGSGWDIDDGNSDRKSRAFRSVTQPGCRKMIKIEFVCVFADVRAFQVSVTGATVVCREKSKS
jgi:hypothetical protein